MKGAIYLLLLLFYYYYISYLLLTLKQSNSDTKFIIYIWDRFGPKKKNVWIIKTSN